MTDFTNVTLVDGGTGVLKFDTSASTASGGYGIFKTIHGHLTFQGGSSGYMYVNQASTAILATMLGDGSVNFWAPPLANAVIFNLRSPSANQLGIYTSTSTGDTRIKSRGYLTLHAGHAEYTAAREMVRLVSDAPTASDARVEIRLTGTPPAGPGTAMLVFRTAEGVSKSDPGPDRLGVYVNTVDGETRIAAHGSLALSAGKATYGGSHEIMRLIPGPNVNGGDGVVGIGTGSPGARLGIKVAAGSAEALNVIAGGNGGGDLPAVSWKSAAGSLLTTQFADGASGHLRIKSSGMLAFHTGPLTDSNRWGDANERMTISTTGNVGIGTNAPAAPLQVGEAGGIASAPRDGRIITAARNSSGAGHRAYEFGASEAWNFGFAIRDTGGGGATRLLINTTGVIDAFGRVNAQAGLQVKDKIYLQEELVSGQMLGRVTAHQLYAFKPDGSGAKKIADAEGCYYA